MQNRRSILLAMAGLLPPPYLEEFGEPETIALKGATGHVQGLAVTSDRIWVSAVHREQRRGVLLEFSRKGGMLRSRDLTSGTRYHPGGICLAADGKSIWVPVAEYRRNSSATILRLSTSTLEPEFSFELDDHIGAVAISPQILFAANWDARIIYEFTPAGKLMRKRENPNATRYQDMKFRKPHLVCSGLTGRSTGAVEWLNPATLQPVRTVQAGVTTRGVPFTAEGMDVGANQLYLLPEDEPSTVYRFAL